MTLTKAMRVLGATALTGALLFTATPTASADQVRDAQWTTSFLGLERAWSVSRGDGVIVAVIDTGVDASHPDLAGSVLEGFDKSGKGHNTDPTDPHGTAMAGIIAAHGHGDGVGAMGVAPAAKILPVFRASSDGTGVFPEGIRWAVDHGAKVINISQGMKGNPGQDKELTSAVAYAAQHDVLIVASAGNDGGGVVESPANEPGIVAVGAVDKSGSIWSMSNYGSQVLLSAPGVGVVAPGSCSGGQYCIGDGTSDATAFVSGTAALVRAKYPELTAGQVANRLTKSAKAAGGKAPDPHYGYGVLSPYDALTKDIPEGSAQGPLTGPYAKTAAGAPSSSAGAASGGGSEPTGGLPAAPDMSGSSSDEGLGAGVLVAVGGAAVLLVVLIAVLVARGRRRPVPVPPQGQQPPYGAPPAWRGNQQQYGQQAPPPGYPPQQYGQQAPPSGYPPQQNPYQNPYGPGGNQPPR
ncbi:type VII secretion-associated serine protease mycosin [Streptomyces sp. TLI_171]|uniref:type VII secretion-associated serine protease mycosin n=1 Tax=Streptomyces sp. TLI_171 TaxID=1938859 RepID=UPI000C18A319|nr:type VII secretion-associated serine protease mycosin [Streptomyces sp. TLI_171]RKE19288.1 type VII secretion-associated serine protease mycosin [Streptomyces sp. TLI_171]